MLGFGPFIKQWEAGAVLASFIGDVRGRAVCSLLVLLINPDSQGTDDVLVGSSEEAELDVLLHIGKQEESC